MVSDKQKSILTKNGYTDADVAKMSYQQVSEAIGKVLANRKPKVIEVNVENRPVDDNKVRSMKVAYAKDIAVAMIHELALLKVDFRDEDVMQAITDNSIAMVGGMWSRL